MRFARQIDKLASLARARVGAEILLPELVFHVGRVLKASALPAFYVAEPGRNVEDFIVWRGSETITDDIRMLLAAGIWPAPPSVPPLGKLLSDPGDRRVHSGTLWGEGCDEEGPWRALWEPRNVRHGLQSVCVDRHGRIGVMLVARDNASPAFDSADIAFVEAAVDIMTAAMSAEDAQDAEPDRLSQQAHFLFDQNGQVMAAGVLGLDILRDICGGGPGAVAVGRGLMEAEARRMAQRGDPEAVTFQDQLLSLSYDGGQIAIQAARANEFARNVFGAFELSLHPMIGVNDGSRRVLGVLNRKEPAALLAVHAAIVSNLPARETDLLLALVEGDSVREAAGRLQIAPSSARTLLERLMGRFAVRDREQLLQAVFSLGRGDDLYAHWNQRL